MDEKKYVDLAAWCRRESVKGGGRDALNGGAHQKCFPDANFHRLAQSILLRSVNVKSIP